MDGETALSQTIVQDIPLSSIALAENDRKEYSGIEELAKSIDEDGLLQPVVARPLLAGQFQLVAGFRRFKAHEYLKRSTIPALVRQLDDAAAYKAMWTENDQRVSLNAIEEAKAIKKRQDELSMSEEQLAVSLRRSPLFVRERLSLLTLNDLVQHLVSRGQLKVGYALAMVGLDSNRQNMAVSALSGIKSLTEYRSLCGKLMAEQSQETMFDMSQFMQQAIEIRDDRKARKQNHLYQVASDLPPMDNADGVGRVLDAYIRKLQSSGLNRESQVVAFVYLELIRFNKAKPIETDLPGARK
jgi:ParB/RepB/Spo0J family partition protein